MLTRNLRKLWSKSKGTDFMDNTEEIIDALQQASVEIYDHVKSGEGLKLLKSSNSSGDGQIGLDIFADNSFRERLSKLDSVSRVVSEEGDDLEKIRDAPFSIALDPIDGSKSALVGIPCGAIFAIFQSVETVQDFCGKNTVGAGFFVFGINLELYIATKSGVTLFEYDKEKSIWHRKNEYHSIAEKSIISINASARPNWSEGLRLAYDEIMLQGGNQRWYASMVSDVKRLIIEGGAFAYPSNSKLGYDRGHLRLIYEAIPMAFLVEALSGAQSDGEVGILDLIPNELHEKVPVYLGTKKLVSKLTS